MRVNYKNTEPGKISPGQYEVTVAAFDIVTSTNGNQQIVLDYEIRKDVHQESQGARIRYDRFTYTESAAWRISAIAKATGIPDGYEFPTPEAFGLAMMRRCFLATVEDREYKGRTYANVTRFDPSIRTGEQPALPVALGDGFMNIPDGVEDDGLPFN